MRTSAWSSAKAVWRERNDSDLAWICIAAIHGWLIGDDLFRRLMMRAHGVAQDSHHCIVRGLLRLC